MSRPIIVVFLMLMTSAAWGQPANWPVVIAQEHFAFPLPPSMELAEGTFQTAIDEGQEYLIVSSQDFSVVAQPRGYSRDAEPFRMPSATILVRVEQGAAGSYAELGADLSMPPAELQQLDDDLRTGFISEGESRGELSNVDWGGTQVVGLEGTQAIRLRYKADVGPNSDRMVVNTYLVQNNDCIYYITLSYLDTDANTWLGDFEAAFGGMRFEKRG